MPAVRTVIDNLTSEVFAFEFAAPSGTHPSDNAKEITPLIDNPMNVVIYHGLHNPKTLPFQKQKSCQYHRSPKDTAQFLPKISHAEVVEAVNRLKIEILV